MKKWYAIFSECYMGSLQCKEVMFRTHNKKLNSRKFLFESAVYFFVLVFKIILSRFFSKSKLQPLVAFSWISYQSRFKDYKDDIFVLDYHYKEFTKNEFSVFRHLKISDIFTVRYIYNRVESNSILNSKFQSACDNVFFRYVNIIEFCLVYGILKNKLINHVVIAGLNDRLTIYVCELARILKVRVTVLQHGAFTKFEGNYLTIADEFCFIYDFSLPYLKYFFRCTDKMQLTHLPQKKSRKIFHTPDWCSKFVTYATTPSNIELNISLIKLIRKSIPSEYKIIVNPHPREELSLYNDLDGVIVTRKKYKGSELFISRISSIGVEMQMEGEVVCFVNLEGHRTDFIDSGYFNVFNRIEELQLFLSNLK